MCSAEVDGDVERWTAVAGGGVFDWSLESTGLFRDVIRTCLLALARLLENQT